jgi:hypothetical protein
MASFKSLMFFLAAQIWHGSTQVDSTQVDSSQVGSSQVGSIGFLEGQSHDSSL